MNVYCAQVSPRRARCLEKKHELGFMAYEWDVAVWWYLNEDLWFWEEEIFKK